MIKISFGGDVKEFAAEGKSYIELVSSVDPKLLNSYVAVKEGENIIDLRDVPADGTEAELVSIDSKEALHVLRHTATHIMQAGLQKFVSPDIRQKGSNITPERLRFDFNCDHKLLPEELKQVEDFVNDVIAKAIPVVCQ